MMHEQAETTWRRVMESHSRARLMMGPTNVDRFLLDPKRLAFFFSRYKFAAKMLSRCNAIIDVGCGDGWGALTFASDTRAARIVGIDFDSSVIDYANDHLLPVVRDLRPVDAPRLSFNRRDLLTDLHEVAGYDGLACMDVIEHIYCEESAEFIRRLASSLTDNGVAVVGTPNAAAAEFGSPHSQIGHINMFHAPRLRASLEENFRHVFMFSMNDEVVHTGFDRLAHYYIVLCVK